ncbi:Mu transposase C-terminal domain-containing protein [Seleniivibrio woodruffii]|uniref:Mu transposase C-terminal domain-containing protein n=1 Tax=Seleniivibrio woodruffii TaxID=1078050 RepID=UPI0026F13F22|nr:Mu transposase C-terminal domain-containing protein [Seleniivibrio woodruffii]
MIVKNQVLKLDDERLVRVLWIDPNNIYAFIYDIDTSGLPERVDIIDLSKSAADAEDPYVNVVSDEIISENHIEKRNDRWRIIENLVTLEPEIYMQKQRGKLIQNTAEITGSHKKFIYVLLKQFWQRGMTKNALLPDYNNCGRAVPTAESQKVGRKKKYNDVIGNGIKITVDIEKIFSHVFKNYHKNAQKMSLMDAYRAMITEYFKEALDSKGNNLAIPSYHQFRRRYLQRYSSEEIAKANKGEKAYYKDVRPLLGNSGGEAYCPGDKYQIDATIADIYLVSSMHREWIVGRPVVYFCIDVFTRMVAGFYVGLTGPSMEGAMMAILNCAEDKVSFCRQFGIEISAEDWPVQNLPKCFLGDNGEMRGITPENAIRSFNIEIETTGSYRADMKGIVERHFRTVHDRVKPVAPGFVLPDYQERGGRDYRQDAVLTIDEFTKIIIHSILEHNDKIIKDYPFDAELAGADITYTPKELWKWGVEHRAGALRTVSLEQLKASLLPHKDATVTSKGIRLHNDVFYTLPLAMELGWFERKSGAKSMKVQLSYNPRNLTEAYIIHNGEYLPVYPTPASNAVGYNLEELEFYTEQLKYKQSLAAKSEFRKKSISDKAINAVINKAKVESELTATSKKKSTQDVRSNRRLEDINRRNVVQDIRKEPEPAKTKDRFLAMLEEVRDEGNENES